MGGEPDHRAVVKSIEREAALFSQQILASSANVLGLGGWFLETVAEARAVSFRSGQDTRGQRGSRAVSIYDLVVVGRLMVLKSDRRA